MISEKPKSNRITKPGLGASIILESQVRAAQDKANSAAEAARVLGVSYNTYKKYAKMYGIMDRLKNQAGVGIARRRHSKNKKYHIDDLLNNKYPTYPLHKFKKKLFNSGYVPEICSCCGFSEARVSDGKYPILLDFLDGNLNNRILENIRPLCFNCFFLLVGNRNLKHYEYKSDDENEILNS
jgi:hypothetical protein